MIIISAVLAGGLGALARYGLTGVVQRRTASLRPWGTATVNILGATVLGVVVGLAATGRLSPDIAYVAGAGFLGSFTTFSTWMVESVRLGEAGGRSGAAAALVNLAGMFTVGLAGALLGLTIGRL